MEEVRELVQPGAKARRASDFDPCSRLEPHHNM